MSMLLTTEWFSSLQIQNGKEVQKFIGGQLCDPWH